MRTFTLLSLLGAAMAASMEKNGQCLVDSGEAVSDALDSSLFIWAASKRCGKKGEEIKCAVDVSSAIKAINSMINVVVKTVDKCDGIHTANKKCGMQAGKLTEHLAGLSAASGEVAQKCAVKNAAINNKGLGAIAAPVMCTVNLKNTAKNLFKVIKDFQHTKNDCDGDHPERCAANALHIVGAFSAMGQWLAGTAGECERAADNKKTPTKTHLCAQASLALVEYLTKVSDDGIEMSKDCEGPETVIIEEQVKRLYESDHKKQEEDTSFTINLALGALLPVAAVLGFVGGKRARHQGVQTREPVFSDNE